MAEGCDSRSPDPGTPFVHNGIVSNRSPSLELSCTCEVDSLRTRSDEYAIAPAHGGGWPAWAEAIARLLMRLVDEPAHCVLVTQPPNQRYLQLMIGHGHAHVEASGNHYLLGDFRLDECEERRLGVLGYEAPGTRESERRLPLNWWCDHERADPETIAGQVLATLTAVMGFDERYPVSVEIFGAESPCAACFWGAA